MKPIKSIINYSGMDCLVVDVECHIASGLPALNVIGYASKSVEEARDRIRASFASSSIQLPKKKITLNLAPADVPKDATSLDLAMAVAILQASGMVELKDPQKTVFLGELGLDGSLKSVRGIIGRVRQAKKQGFKQFYVPTANTKQVNLIEGLLVKPANSLKEVFLDLGGSLPIKTIQTDGQFEPEETEDETVIDLGEIVGQMVAKRALEIAAAGHHNILFHGPPGTGKTMLARAMCGILPPLDHEEVLEVTHLHSLETTAGPRVITARPFRNPHHTASTTALVGGGTNPKPGEASLAHRGVLFLDELAEFSRSSLESLRQPMEDGVVTVARVKDSVTFPAAFILVATQNPCPCGYFGTNKTCECSAAAIAKYRKRVSGPILDRIDLHLEVSGVDYAKLLDTKHTGRQQSPSARNRVAVVYKQQKERFGRSGKFNSSMSNRQIKQLAMLSSAAKKLLDQAAVKMDLSARAYVRSVRVARTIADLGGSPTITPAHISEALQYRQPIETL